MKTKWFIIPVIALSLGCTREIETNVTHIDGEFTLYASSGENETKTVLQRDGSVFWSPGDCITVFYGNIPGKFTSTNTEPAASAEFTGSLGSFTIDGETEFKAIYPHSDDIVMPSDDGKLSIYLPSEQTAVEGTFADDLFICVAKSKDVNLHFYNVCGGVKFSLARGDIKKVVFRGNNQETLAGRMAVEFDSNGIPQVTDMTGGKFSVTLVAPDGETFKVGSFYYLVLVPQALRKGYTIELWTDELVETVSSEASVTVRRSAWGVLKNLGDDDTPMAIPEAIDMGLPSGLKWASFNLGASEPEEYGDYYAWGETEPKDVYSWETYQWCMGSNETLTKYNTNPEYGYNGFTDGKTILDPEDDAAYVNLGGSWRMPTDVEWRELRENCTWTWTTQNGVDGMLVTATNGNSLFIPAAGYRYSSYLLLTGFRGNGWSSSLYTDYNAWETIFDSGGATWFGGTRCHGFSVRPVFGDPAISVESVSLDKTELELSVGETATLTATVLPENATYKMVTWSSSDQSIATIATYSNGVLAAVAPGTATITVTTLDGGKTATCNVTVKESSSTSVVIPEVVDLGLSVKWASFNLGATKPEEYGDYFAWGEIEPYYSSQDPLIWKESKDTGYTWESYKWCKGSENTMTKYCSKSSYGNGGYTDTRTQLDLEDDAAHMKLGDKWRMPTNEEQYELKNNCTWEWTTINGVNGCIVTANNGNSIFLPAGGRRGTTKLTTVGYSGYYWSSSLYLNYPFTAYYLILSDGMIFPGSNDSRYCGFLVRPVYDD